MKILALDQALGTTGYCIFNNIELETVGHFKTVSSKPIEERLCEIMRKLNELLNQYEFEHLVFEDIQKQTNISTYCKLAYVQAAVMIWCYNQNIKFTILSPSHWRKILKENYTIVFGRKREEQKQVAVDFIKLKYNTFVTSDEADACCLGLAYLCQTGQIKEKGKMIKEVEEFEGF